jgi:hypothetical protein
VSLVEQELLALPEHPSSPPVVSGVRVTRSLGLYVYFVNRCLSFCNFSVGHCVVCSSSIYGFWLPLWYLQTLLHKPRVNQCVRSIYLSWTQWPDQWLVDRFKWLFYIYFSDDIVTTIGTVLDNLVKITFITCSKYNISFIKQSIASTII